MRILDTKKRSFEREFKEMLERSATIPSGVENIVKRMVRRVQLGGDKALFAYTRRFDRWQINRSNVRVSREEVRSAYKRVDIKIVRSMKRAAARVSAFHSRQVARSWQAQDRGLKVGEKVSPLERVGMYVPGGRAAYPSTVLMNAIPAKIAGVKEIIMVTPSPQGRVNPYTLVAADLVGVEKIFKIGGAQAVAALAFGTKSVPRVDKIVGPGNIYVAAAKKLVFGRVGIDAFAGPTEVAIIADNAASSEVVVADLISQAEHDPEALAILITSSSELVKRVKGEVEYQLRLLPKKGIARKALQERGVAIKVRNLKEAVRLVDRLAPEHLEVMTAKSGSIARSVSNAGTIFVGPYSPTAFGDYIAGPNHVLPTGGTARFSSPLGVHDFVKRTQVVEVSQQGLQIWGRDAMNMAVAEGLTGHLRSVEVRLRRR